MVWKEIALQSKRLLAWDPTVKEAEVRLVIKQVWDSAVALPVEASLEFDRPGRYLSLASKADKQRITLPVSPL